jgi:hypothetical protein
MKYLKYSLAVIFMITGTLALSIMVSYNTLSTYELTNSTEFIFLNVVFFMCTYFSFELIKSAE